MHNSLQATSYEHKLLSLKLILRFKLDLINRCVILNFTWIPYHLIHILVYTSWPGFAQRKSRWVVNVKGNHRLLIHRNRFSTRLHLDLVSTQNLPILITPIVRTMGVMRGDIKGLKYNT